MSKLDELISLLEKNGLWAKKRFGQNFLIDEGVFDQIIEAADLKTTDNIVEVGPGTGFLTERLIEKVKLVTAIEKDLDMVRLLADRFSDVKNLDVIHSDIIKISNKDYGLRTKQYKVVANIPYYITSPLLKTFFCSLIIRLS